MQKTLFYIFLMFSSTISYSQIVQNEQILSSNQIRKINIEYESTLNNKVEREKPYQFEFDSKGRLVKFVCFLCEKTTAHKYEHDQVEKHFYFNSFNFIDTISTIRPFKFERELTFVHYDSLGRIELLETINSRNKEYFTDTFLIRSMSKMEYDSIFYFSSLTELIKFHYINDTERIKRKTFGFSGNLSSSKSKQTKIESLNEYFEWQESSYFGDTVSYFVENNLLKAIKIIRNGKELLWKEFKYDNSNLIVEEIVYELDGTGEVDYKLNYEYLKK